jgi:glycine oxidase
VTTGQHDDVVVVGGGLIGLATAWRLAQSGRGITVVDPAPVSGASHAAAGMLAPVSEARYGEERLLGLALASLGRYPAFVDELEELTGHDVGLRRTGTLVVATDGGDRAVLTDLHAFQTRLGLEAQLLTSRECKAMEPMLAPTVRAGLFVSGDLSVDNRRLAAALLAAVDRTGGRVVRRAAARVVTDGGRVVGVGLDDGEIVHGECVVIAAGPWSSALDGLPDDALPPVRPVKGQILRLHGPRLLDRTVRALVNGAEVYLVPRAGGELVLGATVEEMGYDVTVRAGAVYDLLRDAHVAVPGVAELELVESTAALRPGSPDNAPVLGATCVDGLYVATGHHRNGVLLTPVTADLLRDAIDGKPHELLDEFSPTRFARTHDTGDVSA